MHHQNHLVTPQYEKVKECWLNLEEAHAATDIEIIETDQDGLQDDVPNLS